MEQRGWIRSEWGTSNTNRKAKYYHVMPDGLHQLQTQASGWERLVLAVSLVLQVEGEGNTV